MRLWLDDIRQMPSGFDYWAKTSQEAIDLINTGIVEFISFDHDLGLDDTGYIVAKHIEGLAYYRRIGPIDYAIHSANPVGRNRINSAMIAACKFWNSP